MMGKIALFPGRFQPPHIGHVLTIMRIYKEYEKIVVAVMDNPCKPRCMEPRKAKEILEAVFRYVSNIEVIGPVKAFTLRKSLEEFRDLPKFDVIVSGNKSANEYDRELGLNVIYTPRTPYYEGSKLRTALGDYTESKSQDQGSK